MHPAIVKAKRIARVAKENDWHGSISSEVISLKEIVDDGFSVEKLTRTTLLTMKRNDEAIRMHWVDKHLDTASYTLCGKLQRISCSKAAIEIIEDWPNIVDILKFSGAEDKTPLIEKYSRLPFDWRVDSDEKIISTLIDHRIYWYARVSDSIYSDVVLKPKNKKLPIQIKPIKDRKSLHYIGSHSGFRCVMLDTILRVE